MLLLSILFLLNYNIKLHFFEEMSIIVDETVNNIKILTSVKIPFNSFLTSSQNGDQGSIVYDPSSKNISYSNGTNWKYLVSSITSIISGEYIPTIITSGSPHTISVSHPPKGYYTVVGNIVKISVRYLFNGVDTESSTRVLEDIISIPSELNFVFSNFSDISGVCQLGLSNDTTSYFGSFIQTFPRTKYFQVYNTLNLTSSGPDIFASVDVTFSLS